MRLRSASGGVTLFVILASFTTLLLCIALASGHPHHGTSARRQRSHHSHHHHAKSTTTEAVLADTDTDTDAEGKDDAVSTGKGGRRRQPSRFRNRNKHRDDSYDDDDDDGEDGGRHAYLMRSDHSTEDKPSPNSNRADNNDSDNEPAAGASDKVDEDTALRQAFEKHMSSSNNNLKNAHDVYAYHLPSDLWFIVRYAKNRDGQVEKYMNIVDSFTNYLDKLEHGVKTVSVNVKGVETVFRLTSKPRQ